MTKPLGYKLGMLKIVELREKARTALFAGLGMPASEMMATGLFPAVVRTEIDYRSPARLGDEIRIVARLAAVEAALAQLVSGEQLGVAGLEQGIGDAFVPARLHDADAEFLAVERAAGALVCAKHGGSLVCR